MRMRFCATIRSPAFSIRALIAPVRLRAVASGLIIEKVRSIAMISSLIGLIGVAGLISAQSEDGKRSGEMSRLAAAVHRSAELPRFHEDEPSLQRPSRSRSASWG